MKKTSFRPIFNVQIKFIWRRLGITRKKTRMRNNNPRIKRSFALLAVKYAFNDVRFYDQRILFARILFSFSPTAGAAVVAVVVVKVSTEVRPFMTMGFSLKYTHVA